MNGMAVLAPAALVLSYLSVMWVRRWAQRRAILAVPNVRSLHDRPMPQGGGLAITAITLSGFLLYATITQAWTWRVTLAYLVGALVVAIVSWVDDLRTLPVGVRLLAHSLAALCIILGVGSWHVLSLPYLGEIDLGWLGPLFTFIWIVGLTNAYNFMDGIDGIAGSQAVIAGMGWAVLGWLADLPIASVLGLLLACTSLGFLGHNWPPARIFMGDVGSAFLGYSLAVLPTAAVPFETRMVITGALLVWPFIFDTAFTFIRRVLKRENVFSAHRSHLYQRLIIAGRSHRFVTLLYIFLAMTGVVMAVIWVEWGTNVAILVLASLSLFLWIYIRWEEGRGVKELPKFQND